MVRFKNRWLLIEFIPYNEKDKIPLTISQATQPGAEVNGKKVWEALRDAVQANFGDVGWGSVAGSLTVKYFSPVTNMCIVRVARDHYRIAWGAVTLMKTIDGKLFIPHVVHVSGTIKHAQLAAIAHNREAVGRMKVQAQVSEKTHHSYDDYLESSSKELEALRD